MSGLIAIAGRPAAAADAESIARAINPLELLDLESFSDNGMLMYVGQHAEAPCRQIAFAARPGFTCLLAGDVVNHAELDWSAIRRSLLAGDAYPDCLRKLRGAFGIVIADHDHNRLWAISDPFAFQSVMVRIGDDGAIVTTSLAAMLRAMPGTALVNDDWIHETIYFNHGTGATTPLVGVARLPAGTIWQVDLDTWAATQRAYRVRAARPSQLCAGPEAIDEALNIFRSTVPRSYPAGASVTIGLSEGLDCRAVLAMTPEHVLERLDSFTFGVERSTEIKEAAKIARKLGLAHTPVLLNDAFLEQLPGLAEETVFLSGGLQNVNRSHLLYTYRSLRSEGDPYSVIMTGVSGDHIFRDHIQGWGNVPHIMSGDAASLHRIGL
ncbi:MAG: hypothetical protein GTO41_29120, partial [Burkholderiales bacterium]|nr:hypothetical protein [Burkholderiales bacterium]